MKIVAVTSCPTGIAHTYMAAESLEEAAKEAGHSIAAATIAIRPPTADRRPPLNCTRSPRQARPCRRARPHASRRGAP